MFKIVCFVMVLAISIFASDLKFVDGYVKAHTEVFGDSTIEPISKDLKVNLSMDEKIESIKGDISFDTKSFTSDNVKRDEHMQEVLKSNEFSTIKATIKSVTFAQNDYVIKADVTLDGVTKEVESVAKIVQKDNIINFDGTFNIKMSDFGVTPPTMFFLTVRDLVEISYNISLSK